MIAASFIDLHLSIVNGFVSSKTYGKGNDVYFDKVNFPLLIVTFIAVLLMVYTLQLIRFARVCNYGADFNARSKCLTGKLLQQGYRYYELRKILFLLNFIPVTLNWFQNLFLGSKDVFT